MAQILENGPLASSGNAHEQLIETITNNELKLSICANCEIFSPFFVSEHVYIKLTVTTDWMIHNVNSRE